MQIIKHIHLLKFISKGTRHQSIIENKNSLEALHEQELVDFSCGYYFVTRKGVKTLDDWGMLTKD